MTHQPSQPPKPPTVRVQFHPSHHGITCPTGCAEYRPGYHEHDHTSLDPSTRAAIVRNIRANRTILLAYQERPTPASAIVTCSPPTPDQPHWRIHCHRTGLDITAPTHSLAATAVAQRLGWLAQADHLDPKGFTCAVARGQGARANQRP